MTHTPLSLRARTAARSSIRVGALVLASLGTVTSVAMVDSGTVSAQTGELPVNALADEVTASARDAVAALDVYAWTGSADDEAALAWHRATTASFTARQLGYDEAAMQQAWADAPLMNQRAVLLALTQVGVPYRTNASVEGEGFDCSGLTSYAWAGSGVEIYHQSSVQISDSSGVTRENALPGDLVHYPGHIMMYLGVDDAIVHSPQTGRTVEISTISRDSVSFGDPTRTR